MQIFDRDRDSRRAAIAATIGLPLLIAAMVVVIGVQWRQTNQARDSVNATYETRLELQKIFSLLQDEETGQRGFMLTAEPSYLGPYNAATSEVQAHWPSLTRRLAGDSPQLDRLRRLQTLSAAKLSEMDRTIRLRRDGRGGEALAIVASGQGRLLMEQMRLEISAMERAGQQQSAAALVRERAVTIENGAVLTSLSLGMLLLVAAVALLLRRGLHTVHREKDLANRANHAKSLFLAMMSHELRTPMNGVLGMAHVLAGSALNPEQRECVDVIETSGNGLLVVLNDILDLSKIEADQIELEDIAFDLIDVIVQSANLWRNAAVEKGVGLELQGFDAEDALFVLGDATRVRQILLNLLSNAVKFTQRGQITVRLDAPKPGTGGLRIDVTDSGPGMSDDVCARLFQPFVQEDASTTRHFGGTGLGLAISRRLARLMGGDLTVASQKGVGTVFALTLPLRAATAPTVEQSFVPVECPAGLNVLVAEDNRQNQMVVRAFLTAMGATCTIVDDGAQAVQAAQSSGFDLVLLDIHMPVMGGEEAMKAIRSGGGPCARIPIIALTADAMTGDRERYITHGFDDHIAKPIEPSKFLDVVGRWSTGAAARAAPKPQAFASATASV
jgi:signal transduction histidine kinase/ActR/RegA family two-component response regulator